MSHKIYFYLVPEDLREVEMALQDKMEFAILEDRSDRQELRFASSLKVPSMGETSLVAYLARPIDIDAISLREIPSQREWAVDALFSPVVELRRCFMDESIVRIGGMFYDDGFYSRGGQWVKKPDSFLKWAQNVLSITKSVLTYDRKRMTYFGAGAKKWADLPGHKLTAN